MPGKTKKNTNKNNKGDKPKKPSQKNIFAAAKAAKNAEKAAANAATAAQMAKEAAEEAVLSARMAKLGVSTHGELAKHNHKVQMKKLAKAEAANNRRKRGTVGYAANNYEKYVTALNRNK